MGINFAVVKGFMLSVNWLTSYIRKKLPLVTAVGKILPDHDPENF